MENITSSSVFRMLPEQARKALEEAQDKSEDVKNILKSLQTRLEKAGDNKDEVIEVLATLLQLTDTSFNTVADIAEKILERVIPNFLQEN